MKGEEFKGYNHTGRRFQGIQSCKEKVSRDTIMQGYIENVSEDTKGRSQKIQIFGRVVTGRRENMYS